MSEIIPLAGVIGDPIGHSKSPVLHGHWLNRYGIAGHYVPLHVEHDNFKRVLKTLPKMGFKGVNVTIPHKEFALSLADTVTDRAALIGAANTLTFTAKGVQADNTDGVGFITNIRQEIPAWDATAAPAMVLGAGGAARAVLSAASTGRRSAHHPCQPHTRPRRNPARSAWRKGRTSPLDPDR